MQTVHLAIDGMSCGHCVARVRAALGRIDGVTLHEVQVGAAELEFDPGLTTLDTIRASIREVGFGVRSAGNVVA